jgi:hypothetical protein
MSFTYAIFNERTAMLRYKKSEARESARENIRGLANVVIPSYSLDLKRLNEREGYVTTSARRSSTASGRQLTVCAERRTPVPGATTSKGQVIARSKGDVAISWRTSSGRSEIASSRRSSQ